MAGTWLVAMPAVMRAMSFIAFRMERLPLGERPPARIIAAYSSAVMPVIELTALLRAPAVGVGKLDQEIDVAAQFDQLVEIAVEHGLLLLLAHPEAVEIGALVDP